MQFVFFKPNLMPMQIYGLAIHGGAGTLVKDMMTAELEQQYLAALERALALGYEALKSGRSAIDAVELAVKELEDCPLFNAGRGSVFTSEGKHEMDASIMEGEFQKAGAVSLVSGLKNPISLARDVMEKTDHVYLAGKGAMQFAEHLGYQFYDNDYFFDEFRFQQWQEIKDTDRVQLDHTPKGDEKFGTVGAVACDQFGHLAAATSTGGMTNKRYGRIGDSSLIGCGTYAYDKTCAVSCTGNGEFFIRSVAAYDVSALMEFRGIGLDEATRSVVHERVKNIGGEGGLIAIDRHGNVSLPFNSEGMYRAYRLSDGQSEMAIYK